MGVQAKPPFLPGRKDAVRASSLNINGTYNITKGTIRYSTSCTPIAREMSLDGEILPFYRLISNDLENHGVLGCPLRGRKSASHCAVWTTSAACRTRENAAYCQYNIGEDVRPFPRRECECFRHRRKLRRSGWRLPPSVKRRQGRKPGRMIWLERIECCKTGLVMGDSRAEPAESVSGEWLLLL